MEPQLPQVFVTIRTSRDASRSEFWWFQLFLVLGSIGTSAIWEGLNALWFVATIIPYLAIGVRRLRDAGFSWALLLLGLIPVLGTITVIVLWVQPSKVDGLS